MHSDRLRGKVPYHDGATQVDGHVSEQLFHGALGGGIPIYFGARDVWYVNGRAVVHCQLDRKVFEKMRSFYPPKKPNRKFLFREMDIEGKHPTDEELLAWSEFFLRPHLKNIINRVIALYQNDTAYEEVLRRPFIINLMPGMYPLTVYYEVIWVQKI